jgi:hypothetical protein
MDLKEILPQFQGFLRDRRLATEKNIPYHALWASRFLRFARKRPERKGAQDATWTTIRYRPGDFR